MREPFGHVIESDDLLDVARAMRAMDLMISVDTMAAHLAGALGIRTWTLLQHDPDWRWMEGIDHSPWYPTMRLFRQAQSGEWRPVIDRVRAALAHFSTLFREPAN
jgi:ADP-heptose:LPS heptosyltransferase